MFLKKKKKNLHTCFIKSRKIKERSKCSTGGETTHLIRLFNYDVISKTNYDVISKTKDQVEVTPVAFHSKTYSPRKE